MQGLPFLAANKVFKGKLRKLKKLGYDTTHSYRDVLSSTEMDKIYNEYFMPNIYHNPRVLQHKVYFDLSYHMARRGKQNLRKLSKESFQIQKTPQGQEYVELTFNEATKKCQGDEMNHNPHDGDRNIMLAQPDSDRCPVKSFKFYMEKLNPKCPWFFQTPNPYMSNPAHDLWYKNCPVGEGMIGRFMKQISQSTNLPKLYTNHKIRGTTASVMKDKFGLFAACNVTHHKSYESLRSYLAKPTLEDKAKYSTALFNFPDEAKENAATSPKPKAKNPSKLSLKRKPSATLSKPPPSATKSPLIQLPPSPKSPSVNEQNASPPSSPPDSQATIIYTPPKDNVLAKAVAVTSPKAVKNVSPKVGDQISNLLQNVYKQAPTMFTGAQFHGCTFNINLPNSNN